MSELAATNCSQAKFDYCNYGYDKTRYSSYEDCLKNYPCNDSDFIPNEGGNAILPPHEGGGRGGKLPNAPKPKVEINYVNTAIFGAIGGGAGYLVAKKLIKTDKVLLPVLIGAAAFAYWQIDITKKMAGKSF